MSKTGEEIGYEDAMRQIERALNRRLKALKELEEEDNPEETAMIHARYEEVKHLIQVVESLHR